MLIKQSERRPPMGCFIFVLAIDLSFVLIAELAMRCISLTPHCLRQFARVLGKVRAAKPAPSPRMGESPQAARRPEGLRRPSPHLPQEWASRRRRLGDLNGYIRHFKCVLSKLYNIIT